MSLVQDHDASTKAQHGCETADQPKARLMMSLYVRRLVASLFDGIQEADDGRAS